MNNKIKLFIKDIEKELEKIDIIVNNILELKNILIIQKHRRLNFL